MGLTWKQKIGMLSVGWEINWTGQRDVWRPMSCGNQGNGGLDYRIAAVGTERVSGIWDIVRR